MMKIYDRKLAYPYFVWMTLFTVVPLIIVVYYALTDSDGNFTLNNLLSISGYGSVFARSLLLALIATVICLIIAFPVGYFLSRLRVNKQHIMLMLVMLPMWMNFLLRTYAWMGLLSTNGPVNAADIRKMGDQLKDRFPNIVAVLAATAEDKATMLAVCGKNAVGRGIKAGQLIKEVSAACGGSGGGKPDSAMGGGKDVTKVDNALAIVDDYVVSKLK